jgi:hypothetical protein
MLYPMSYKTFLVYPKKKSRANTGRIANNSLCSKQKSKLFKPIKNTVVPKKIVKA